MRVSDVSDDSQSTENPHVWRYDKHYYLNSDALMWREETVIEMGKNKNVTVQRIPLKDVVISYGDVYLYDETIGKWIPVNNIQYIKEFHSYNNEWYTIPVIRINDSNSNKKISVLIAKKSEIPADFYKYFDLTDRREIKKYFNKSVNEEINKLLDYLKNNKIERFFNLLTDNKTE